MCELKIYEPFITLAIKNHKIITFTDISLLVTF